MPTDAAWRTGIVKCVEFYVRSAAEPRKAYAVGSTLIDSSDREDSWAGTVNCRVCNRIMIDLPPLDQPETGWPDVVVMTCDEGSHSFDEA